MGPMAHLAEQRPRLLARVRRLRGQVEAIERALEAEADCTALLHLIAGARGAMAGLMAEVVEDHVRHHLARPADALDGPAAEALVGLIRTYLR